jgi:tetratricopeptide (TPR) repeat protein
VRWLSLLVGLPAVLLAAALLTLLWQNRRVSLQAAYQADVEARLKKGDWPGALVDLKRLTAMNPERPDYRLYLAMVLEQVGQPARGEALARTIAPLDDRPSYAPAHLWLARRMLIDQRAEKGRLEAAEQHLLKFLKENPSNVQAKMLIGDLYAMTGRPRQARPYLEEVAGDNPYQLVNLANICKATGDMDECRRRANMAIEAARKVCLANPDNVFYRVQWANAHMAMNDYESALAVLAEGLRPDAPGQPPEGDKDKDRGQDKGKDPAKDKASAQTARENLNTSIRHAQALVCVAWADAVALSNKAKPPERLAVIERGFTFEPKSFELLSRLADLLQYADGEVGKKVRARLDGLLADGQFPGVIHFALGNDAWKRGKRDEARAEWEKSVASAQFLPLAANNLAYALGFDAPKDLPRAQALVEKALAKAPNDPRVLGTRGQLMTQLERWKEAADDLEAALTGGENTPGIHRALADAYGHLGKRVLEEEHRKKARGSGS